MSLRAPLLSIFRPQHPIDQTVLAENRKLLDNIDRRHVLRGTLSLGALTLLTGCDVTDRPAVQAVLNAVSAFNDRVQALLFNPDRLARTFTDADVVRPPRFNAFYAIEQVKPVNAADWKLELAGRIEK